MSFLFYLIGLIVGVVFFIYFFSLYESGKEKLAARSTPARQKTPVESSIEIQPDAVSAQSYPRGRICPLCGAVLTRLEPLYASRIGTTDGEKILIYGCRYCYKPDDSADARARGRT